MTIKQQGGIFGRNPTFNDVELNKLIVDNRIGIGTSNPSAPLDIVGTPGTLAEFRDGTAANFIIETSGNVTTIGNQAGASVLAFKQSNQERMRITNDGLCFNGDTAAANALDDYEEGTWTPVPADAASGGNTGSASVAVGSYTKVGRLVHVTVELTNINTSGLTAGNRFYIQGLPYAASNESGSPNYTAVAYMNDITFSSQPIWLVGDNTSSIGVLMNTSGGTWSALNVSALTASTSDIELSVTYQAAV